MVPLTKDPHYEVRYVAAEALGDFRKTRAVVSALVDALFDKDEVVRLNAALSLGKLRAREAFVHLVAVLTSDDDPLVRSYAAMAIGDIGDKSMIRVLRLVDKGERNATTRMGIQKALYDLGERSRLREFLRGLDSPGYRDRCACANLVVEMVEQSNVAVVSRRLRRRLAKERTVAVRSSIEAALASIKSRFGRRRHGSKD